MSRTRVAGARRERVERGLAPLSPSLQPGVSHADLTPPTQGGGGGAAEPRLVELVDSWCTMMEARGLAQSSVRSQRAQVLGGLRSIATEAGCTLEELALSEWSVEKVAAAVAAYRTQPDRRYRSGGPRERSAGSVRQRIVALRSFGEHLAEEELVPRNAAAGLRAPRALPGSTGALSLEDAQTVLETAALSRAPERDTLVASLALTMGCTLGEIASIELGDRRGDTLRLRSARGEREAALSPACARAWDAWLPVREALLARFGLESSKLVLSLRVRTVGEGEECERRLDTAYSGVGEILSRLVQASGLSAGRAHLLRATFATLALSSGSHTLAQLRAQLGCESIEALRPYAQQAGVELSRAARAHPLGR